MPRFLSRGPLCRSFRQYRNRIGKTLSFSLGHGWLVSSVDFGNVVSLDAGDIVASDESGERNSQVVSQGSEFSTLVF